MGLFAASWLPLGACTDGPEVETVPPPEPWDVVLERVNANSRKMDFLLRAIPANAAGRLTLDDGRQETFDLPAKLLFRKPRGLFLQLEHALFGKIEIGSNDEEFWTWIQFDEPRYWWGRHDLIASGTATDMPIRPDHLVDVLGLSDLPEQTGGPLGPIPWLGSNRYELNFLGRDPVTEQLYYTRSVDIDRREPFLIREVVYFRRDGRPYLTADLNDYRPIDGTDVRAPRRVRVDWLDSEDWLELTFRKMGTFDTPAQAERAYDKLIARSPRERGEPGLGRQIRVDQGATD